PLTRLRQVGDSVVAGDRVARAGYRRHAHHRREPSLRIEPRDDQPRGAGGRSVQLVTSLHVVDVVDSVAHVDRRQPPSIATRVEHHYAIPAGDEEKIEGLIERQPFRSIVAAAGEPRRRDPPAPHVDPQRAILVLEVGEEDAARGSAGKRDREDGAHRRSGPRRECRPCVTASRQDREEQYSLSDDHRSTSTVSSNLGPSASRAPRANGEATGSLASGAEMSQPSRRIRREPGSVSAPTPGTSVALCTMDVSRARPITERPQVNRTSR